MNKKIISLTVFIILGMLIFPTIYKIYHKHNDNLILVVEKEFLYQAKTCYNRQDCSNSKVYLKELYDQNYLTEKLFNPLTKKYYDENSYVDLNTNEVKLIS